MGCGCKKNKNKPTVEEKTAVKDANSKKVTDALKELLLYKQRKNLTNHSRSKN